MWHTVGVMFAGLLVGLVAYGLVLLGRLARFS